jgi:uncharacterized protein (TIGR02996 family)
VKPFTEATYRRKTKALAGKLGLDIDVEYDYGRRLMTVWVYPRVFLYAAQGFVMADRTDPRDGDHCAANWAEAWDIVCEYCRDLAEIGWGVADGGLLAAALADDRNRFGWLVFADWLEENGYRYLPPVLRGFCEFLEAQDE